MPIDRQSGLSQSLRMSGLETAHILLLIPLGLAAAFAFSGPYGLILAALLSTAAVSAILAFRLSAVPKRHKHTSTLMDRPFIADITAKRLDESLFCLAAFSIEIDEFRGLTERFKHAKLELLLTQCEARLRDCLIESDCAARLDGPTFMIICGPDRTLDLASSLQKASRIQAALSRPYKLAGSTLNLSVSVGFALSNRMGSPRAEDLLLAATTARIDAQRNGPGAIRSYSTKMQHRIEARRGLVDDVGVAFKDKQICAYFQPQVCTQTGDITGFESLARWHHPLRGSVSPSEFLPAIQDAGEMTKLGELMLREALSAINTWEDAGVSIPKIAVNLSTIELSDPSLMQMVENLLNEFNLGAERLNIEVLETVVANKVRGTVIDNLAQLAELGCGIDLDDFGTGHASITSIRRFSIERIKIDRSFITGIDEDPEQQDMVSAILTMADRLGLKALAEGVETQSEEVMLARLGCSHIQGFGVAHPMPLSDTIAWITAHRGRDTQPLSIGHSRRAV